MQSCIPLRILQGTGSITHRSQFDRSAWQTNQSDRCCTHFRRPCTTKVIEDGEHQRLLGHGHCKHQAHWRLHGTRICVDSIHESLERCRMHREKYRCIVFVVGCSHQLVELYWRQTLPKPIQTGLVRIGFSVAILCVCISLLQRTRALEFVLSAALDKREIFRSEESCICFRNLQESDIPGCLEILVVHGCIVSWVILLSQ